MMMTDSGTIALTRDYEPLLPWRAVGALPPAEARDIDLALRRDARLARCYAGIREERAGIVALHEGLGAPSPRALLALFAAIDLDFVRPEKAG